MAKLVASFVANKCQKSGKNRQSALTNWLKRQHGQILDRPHNPKVGGSNPSPAIKAADLAAFFSWGYEHSFLIFPTLVVNSIPNTDHQLGHQLTTERHNSFKFTKNRWAKILRWAKQELCGTSSTNAHFDFDPCTKAVKNLHQTVHCKPAEICIANA